MVTLLRIDMTLVSHAVDSGTPSERETKSVISLAMICCA
jgi:hypothetical protein